LAFGTFGFAERRISAERYYISGAMEVIYKMEKAGVIKYE